MHLPPDVGIYYNPNAGSGQAVQISQMVRETLRRREVTFTTLPKGITVSEASDIIVIGGDGTFNCLLNKLVKPHLYRFILLPAGTSNSLCSQICSGEDALSILNHYLEAPDFINADLPQLTIHDKTYRFINEASVGFAAAIAREIETTKTKKMFNSIHLNELSYIYTAFRCWWRSEPIMLSFCNNRRISGNLIPCVNAKLDDGRIDVFELHCSRLRLPFELTRLVGATKDSGSPYVQRSQVQAATWQFENPLPVEIDGNPAGNTTSISLSLYDKQIRIFSTYHTHNRNIIP